MALITILLLPKRKFGINTEASAKTRLSGWTTLHFHLAVARRSAGTSTCQFLRKQERALVVFGNNLDILQNAVHYIHIPQRIEIMLWLRLEPIHKQWKDRRFPQYRIELAIHYHSSYKQRN